MRDIVRRALIGWLRVVGGGAERVSRTAGEALERLGGQPGTGQSTSGQAGTGQAGTGQAGTGQRGTGQHGTAPWESRPDRAVIAALTEQLRHILELPPPSDGRRPPQGDDGAPEALRERFSELLRRSLAAVPPPESHPAFRRIIDELSPDEARIIRFFDEHGPQPVVDVVASPRIGSGARTVAENLSLVGDRAGCHQPDLTPTYLSNLTRLGVVKIHDQELVGHDDYELIEARPEYKTAAAHIETELRQRVRSERRTAGLTPLGKRFCAVCLPDETGVATGTPVAHREDGTADDGNRGDTSHDEG